MAIFDLTSNLEVEVILRQFISSNETNFSSSIDVSDFDGGFYLTSTAFEYVDGTFVVTLQDSPDDSVWTDIDAEKLIDPSGLGSFTLNSITSSGDLLQRIGAFSVDKFVRTKVVSTGVTIGAVVMIIATKMPEQVPA